MPSEDIETGPPPQLQCPECGTVVHVYRNPLPTVDVIIEMEDGSIVLIHRKNPPLGWALPGGFVDYGETVENAARREAREETGLDIELRGLVGCILGSGRGIRGVIPCPSFLPLRRKAAFAQGTMRRMQSCSENIPFPTTLHLTTDAFWRTTTGYGKPYPDTNGFQYERQMHGMEIKKIGVLGAGTMGHGIALVSARIGCDVVLLDVEERFVENGLNMIDKFLSKSVQKGKMTEDEKNAVARRITGTTKMQDLADVDFIIEAVLEDIELKKKVFKELDSLCRPEVILASNTSSMSLTEIGAATGRPGKVVGMHFFNPVPIMRLVEVIRGLETDDETVRVTTELAEKMGKVTVEVKKDSPGFIVNRIMLPHMIEAIRIVEEGIASVEDVGQSGESRAKLSYGAF